MSDSNTKGRLLFLEHYLNDYTDEEHPVTADDLMRVYEENGYKANRSTIRDDIAVLQESGIDIIIDQDGKYKTFYIGNRLFELAEIKTLIDAVSSSRFITAEKSESLIRKLTEMTSIHSRESLLNHSSAFNRIKADIPGIFRTIDLVNSAIEKGKKISFQYIDYLPNKEEILRNNGKEYVMSPQTLIWVDDRYYMLAYSEKKGSIVTFRIDRMKNVKILKETAIIDETFDPSEYSRKVLHMFDGDEEELEVILVAENKYMLNIIDRFGDTVSTEIIDAEHFSAKITVCPSYTFFAWLFQFCGGICIAGPKSVSDKYIKLLNEVTENQQKVNLQ